MMAKKKELTPVERKALKGYELWFSANPGVLNPTDMNTMEKYYFAMWFCSSHNFGVNAFAKMIAWRKNSPHSETKYEHWQEKYPLPTDGEVKVTKLEEYSELEAKINYCNWFYLYPDSENPTDINSDYKLDFLQKVGWEVAVMMERARKNNTGANRDPRHWTKPVFWKSAKNAPTT
jgi:hypothetical protein